VAVVHGGERPLHQLVCRGPAQLIAQPPQLVPEDRRGKQLGVGDAIDVRKLRRR